MATSDLSARLGERLVSRDIVAGRSLQAAVSLGEREHRPLGEIVLDQGWADPAEVQETLTERVMDALLDLLLQMPSSVEWEELEPARPQVSPAADLVMALRKARAILSEAVFADAEPWFSQVAHQDPSSPIRLSAQEWRLISGLRGQTRLSHLAESAGLDHIQATRVLQGLVDRGLLARTHAPAPPDLGPTSISRKVDVGISPPPPPESKAGEVIDEGVAAVTNVVAGPGPLLDPDPVVTSDRPGPRVTIDLSDLVIEDEGGPGAPSLSSTRPFHVAVVCTHNQFRSPLTKALIEHHLPEKSVVVESFGLRGKESARALPIAEEAARSFGVDVSNHEAHNLSQGALTGAELVLGFEQNHLEAAYAIGGAPPEVTFTINEFVTLLRRIDLQEELQGPERWREMTRRATRMRDHDVNRLKGGLELLGPVGGPPSAYLNAASRLSRLVSEMCSRLMGVSLQDSARPVR
jgi:protein-tyrosine-phosphatase